MKAVCVACAILLCFSVLFISGGTFSSPEAVATEATDYSYVAFDGSSVRINSAEEFFYIAECIGKGDSIAVTDSELKKIEIDSKTVNIILESDIELVGEITPIGTEELPFCGSFDGNGYTIGVYSGVATCLFGCVSNAELRNVTVKGETAGESWALVEYAENPSVEGCFIDMSCNSRAVGGLFLDCNGDVLISNTKIRINSPNLTGSLGGIAVKAEKLTIKDCEITIDVYSYGNDEVSVVAGVALQAEEIKATGLTASGAFGAVCGFGLVKECDRLAITDSDVSFAISSEGFLVGEGRKVKLDGVSMELSGADGVIGSADELDIRDSFIVMKECKTAFKEVCKTKISRSRLYARTNEGFAMTERASSVFMEESTVDVRCDETVLLGESTEGVTLTDCVISIEAKSAMLCRYAKTVNMKLCEIEASGEVCLFEKALCFKAESCNIRLSGRSVSVLGSVGISDEECIFSGCRIYLQADGGECAPVLLSEGRLKFSGCNITVSADGAKAAGCALVNRGGLEVNGCIIAVYVEGSALTGGIVGLSDNATLEVRDSQVSGRAESAVFGGIAGSAVDSNVTVKGTVFAATPISGRFAMSFCGLLFGKLDKTAFLHENTAVCAYNPDEIGLFGFANENHELLEKGYGEMVVGWINLMERLVYDGSCKLPSYGGMTLVSYEETKNEDFCVKAGVYALSFEAESVNVRLYIDIVIDTDGYATPEMTVTCGEEIPEYYVSDYSPVKGSDTLKLIISYYDEDGIEVTKSLKAGSYTFIAKAEACEAELVIKGRLNALKRSEYELPSLGYFDRVRVYDGNAVVPPVYIPDESVSVRLRYTGTTIKGRSYDSELPPKVAGSYTVYLIADASGFYEGFSGEKIVDKRDFEILPESVTITAVCEPVAYDDVPIYEWVLVEATALTSIVFIPDYQTLTLELPEQPDLPETFVVMPKGALGGEKYSVAFLPVSLVFTKRSQAAPVMLPKVELVSGGVRLELPVGCEWAIDKAADFTASDFIPNVKEGKHTVYLRFSETLRAYPSPTLSFDIDVKYPITQKPAFFIAIIAAAAVAATLRIIRKKKE